MTEHLRVKPLYSLGRRSTAHGDVYHIYGHISLYQMKLFLQSVPIHVFKVVISVYRAMGHTVTENDYVNRAVLLKSLPV